MGEVNAGWFVDPMDPGGGRYWDGEVWTTHTTSIPPGGTLPGFPVEAGIGRTEDAPVPQDPTAAPRQIVIGARHLIAVGAVGVLLVAGLVGVAVSSQGRAQRAEDQVDVLEAKLAGSQDGPVSASTTSPSAPATTTTTTGATVTTAPDPDGQCKQAMYNADHAGNPTEDVFDALDDCTEEQWNRLAASHVPSNHRTLQDLCDSRMGVPASACGSADAARVAREATTTAPPPATPPPTAGRPSGGGSVSQSNARQIAADYLDSMPFSRSGLIHQLQYEGFSLSDSTYGVDTLDVDWNEQAAKKAAQYLETMPFSRSSLIDQLLYEGFTQAQAEYGVSTTGL